MISYTAEALVSGYCPNERVYWISSAPTALRRLFAGQMLLGVRQQNRSSAAAVQELAPLAVLSFLVPSRHIRCSVLPPGYWGGSWWRVTAYLLAEDIEILSVTPKKSIGGERGLLHNLLFYRTNRNNTWQRPAIRLCGRGKPPICAADLSNKGVLFPIIPLTMGTQVLVCS